MARRGYSHLPSLAQHALECSSKVFDVTIHEILQPGRTRTRCRARWCVMHLLRRNTTLSLLEIGTYLNVDHSSVLYGVRKVETMIAEEDVLADLFLRSEELFHNGKVERTPQTVLEPQADDEIVITIHVKAPGIHEKTRNALEELIGRAVPLLVNEHP